MPHIVATAFNTRQRRFAVGQLIEDGEDLGGAGIDDVMPFLVPPQAGDATAQPSIVTEPEPETPSTGA